MYIFSGYEIDDNFKYHKNKEINEICKIFCKAINQYLYKIPDKYTIKSMKKDILKEFKLISNNIIENIEFDLYSNKNILSFRLLKDDIKIIINKISTNDIEFDTSLKSNIIIKIN